MACGAFLKGAPGKGPAMGRWGNAAALLVAVLAALPVSAQEGEAVLLDRVVAYIGDDAITLHDVRKRAEAARNPVAGAASGAPTGEDVTLVAALDDLVDERLILAEAAKLGIEATEADVDRHVQGILDQNEWTPDDFASAVKMLGFVDLAAYRVHARKELVKSQVLRLKVGAKVRVTDREVEEAFLREYAGGAVEPEVHLWHIFFPIPENVDEAGLVALIERAAEVRRIAATGERPFEDLAREFGGDGAAAKGGDVGWFRRGRLQASLEETAFALADGEISGVVQSAAGFHVLRVTERRQVPLADIEEAKARIRYELTERGFEREYKAWVRSLRASGRIVVRSLAP
jgi:peptidyl-prolyl cis-trans isomerase SurA